MGNLICTEIVEFMPHKDDPWKRSEQLMVNLVESIYLPKIYAEAFGQHEEKRQARG
jgi:hypothetical protein